MSNKLTEAQLAMLKRVVEYPKAPEDLPLFERGIWGFPAGPRDREYLDALKQMGLVRKIFGTFNYLPTKAGVMEANEHGTD